MENNRNSFLAQHKYFLLTVLFGGFFLSLTLWFGFGLDQSIYAYGAWVWKTYHQPPYSGTWDPNYPGIFIINLAVQEIFGDKIISFRVFDFLVQMTSLAMTFYLAKKLSGSEKAGVLAGVLFSIYYFSNGMTDTGQREGYILWLMLIAITVSFAFDKKVWLRAAVAGLCLGSAVLLKPTFGLSWLVFGIFFLVQGIKQRPKLIWAELALYAVCCFLPALLVILYYWRIDQLPELYKALIWYNFSIYRITPNLIYANLPKWFLPIILLHDLFVQEPVLLFAAVLAVLIFPIKSVAPRQKTLFWLLLFLCATNLFSYLLLRKYFPYHLLPFWGIFIILAAWAWTGAGSILQAMIQNGSRKFIMPVFYFLLVVLMLASVNPEQMIFSAQHSFRGLQSAYLDVNGYYSDPHQTIDQHRAVARIQSLLRPNEKVDFCGSYPLIPFLLKQKMASRFCCLQYVLATPPGKEMSSRQKQWIQEYSDAIINEKPRFFVIHDYIPGYISVGLSSPSMKTAISEKFPDLEKFLRQNYRLTDKIGTVEIYEFKPQ